MSTHKARRSWVLAGLLYVRVSLFISSFLSVFHDEKGLNFIKYFFSASVEMILCFFFSQHSLFFLLNLINCKIYMEEGMANICKDS